jgi:hypothetical protein
MVNRVECHITSLTVLNAALITGSADMAIIFTWLNVKFSFSAPGIPAAPRWPRRSSMPACLIAGRLSALEPGQQDISTLGRWQFSSKSASSIQGGRNWWMNLPASPSISLSRSVIRRQKRVPSGSGRENVSITPSPIRPTPPAATRLYSKPSAKCATQLQWIFRLCCSHTNRARFPSRFGLQSIHSVLDGSIGSPTPELIEPFYVYHMVPDSFDLKSGGCDE